MKNKYWFAVILFFAITKAHGQDIRVGNNFIILINGKLAQTIEGVKLVLSDANGKEESIHSGYIPGELSVSTIEAKNVLFGDSVRTLTLKFDYDEYGSNKTFIHNFKIGIDRHWFKTSLIILRIFDFKKRQKTYKYSFEVPGIYFAKPGYVSGK